MFNRKWKSWVSALTVGGLLLGLLPPGGWGTPAAEAAGTPDYGKVPKLLITELVPDSSNVAGKAVDAFEFIEVYNNSKQTVNFKDYTLAYLAGSNETVWSAVYNNDMAIAPQQTIVLWVMNADNTNEPTTAFNANYGTSLQENVNLFRVNGGGGMSNSAPRSLLVKDKSGSVISSASYQNDAQTVQDMGIVYQYPTDGSVNMTMSSAGTTAASPGRVEAFQVPALTPDDVPSGPNLQISHTPPAEASNADDLPISAVFTGNQQTVTAAVYYKTGSQSAFSSLPMAPAPGGGYTAKIPRESLAESVLQYFIQAKDGSRTVTSETYTVTVKLPDFDYSKLPPILVTELLPNSTNVGGADGYEFIEIYNNTDKPINFKDYKLFYRYTDSGPEDDVIWPTDREDLILPPKKPFVFWIINSQNTAKTVADFNAAYQTNLVENTDIVKVYSDGMANGSKRGVSIGTNTHVDVSVAYYDGSLPNETKENYGIVYKYPMDGTGTMIKASAGLKTASPGSLEPWQVPAQSLIVTPDTSAPTVANLTQTSQVEQWSNLELVADAKDDRQVLTTALYFRSDNQAEYTKRYLYQNYNDKKYHYTVYSPDLIGKTYIEYYFKVSDGTNETTSPVYRSNVTGGMNKDSLRLNLKDGELVSGQRIVKAAAGQSGPDAVKLAIDGQDLSSQTYAAMESDAYFAFEAASVDYYFKNAVTIGKEIIYTFQDPIPTYQTLSVPIGADRLRAGSNVFSIRAGSKSSPFDDRPEENKDDFNVKNVRLVLADGTALYDPKYANKEKEIKMGDSDGRFEALDFQFNLDAGQLRAKAYAWDTKQLSDGVHQVTAASAVYGTVTANVTVDNTAPVIEPSVESGKVYRGAITLDAKVTDALTGVKAVEAALNGKPVKLPYVTTSSQLGKGTYTLVIRAADNVGNKAESTVSFEVPEEDPHKPTVVAPVDGQTGVDPNAVLKVQVEDPNNDAMNVAFYRGFHYGGSHRGGLTAKRGAADIEPPKQLELAGEKAFTEEDYRKIGAVDGDYLVDDSVGQFPYHRFEAQLDPSVQATDRVKVEWKGKSLEGRKVSLYGWSPKAQQWTMLDSKVAGAEDFALTATVTAGEYNTNGTIQLIVQDELPVSQQPYDFSFLWMSDTQYYSESYPEIYRRNVQWIAENQDAMKIKYVVHTGDIVDEADKEYQWIEADRNMKVLEDAKVPYGVLAGNHDVSHQLSDYTQYWKYFGEDRFKKQPTFGGSYQNNRGHYDLVSAGGNDFIFVYMGWNIGDAEIQWMDEVLKQYPDRRAILNFHEFLLVSGNRAPIADKIYEKVVVPNKNVIAVLSGHYHDAETKIDPIDDDGDGKPDRTVYQMLADYQGAEKGGLGYIRLLQFDVNKNKIYVKTYSPYLDDYNYYDPKEYPGKDELELDVNLTPMQKRVATDYMSISVYTDQAIGQAAQVAGGQEASVVWSGLQPQSYYQWYVRAADNNSGQTLSDIWGFTTGDLPPTDGTDKAAPVWPEGSALKASDVTDTAVTLSWSAATDNVAVTGYRIKSGDKELVKLSGDKLSYRVTGLSSDTRYTFQVEAVDAAGNWTAGPSVTVRTESSSSSSEDNSGSSSNGNGTGANPGTTAKPEQPKPEQPASPKPGKETPTAPTPAPAANPFRDVTESYSWASEAIAVLASKGIIQGTSDTTFEPGQNITRADFITLLVRALGLKGDFDSNFSDVNPGDYYYQGIGIAKKLGITDGVGDNKFNPKEKISRQDLMVLTARALDVSKKLEIRGAAADLASYSDQAAVASYATNSVAAMVKAGIVEGNGSGLNPQGQATRAETAVILYRIFKKL
ncbi:S-layer homology domain-containing protein [Paenibacillus oleatilyticus]|uniref:S-layer homology domain-containing protein n=1 Tax=Paenibacillus oleatilyticus TaxID=2594886 RepID=UPI001C1F6482|nr:S-layer homology domain-containing protein [Paenibacillus oleatilyticus]MBU7316212.1 S-layer homology domain-containing protein [Paenibacillus oleatilyticus]